VESQEQWRWLQGLGCERFQGHLFSPALPSSQCRDLVLQGGLDHRIERVEAALGA
jgi:EAL domain-containing protein (putative c-di-GMP-specific phosphodiesterase class I)